jgi:hypothetical protein
MNPKRAKESISAINKEVKRLELNKQAEVAHFTSQTVKEFLAHIKAVESDFKKALNLIRETAKDYVPEGTRHSDCVACGYDGDIVPHHHPECRVKVAKEFADKYK